MRPGVDVVRVAFERGTIARLGFGEFALLKIDVAQLRVVLRVVEMVNLGLQFLDTLSVERAGEFESTRSRWRTAIDVEEIPESGEAGEYEDKDNPAPLAAPHSIDQHP